jgi:hypothetical protein
MILRWLAFGFVLQIVAYTAIFMSVPEWMEDFKRVVGK